MLFIERVSPALEQVDGSSGAMGTAVPPEDQRADIAENVVTPEVSQHMIL